MGVSLALFMTVRMFAKGSPGTMNKEYQEATNEYLKVGFALHSSPPYLFSFFVLGNGSLGRGWDVICGWSMHEL